MNKILASAVVGGLCVVSAPVAEAAVVGSFDFNGFNAVRTAVGDTYIDFGDPFQYMTSGCDANPGTPCNFVPDDGRIRIEAGEGWFEGADGTGTVKDLTFAEQTPGTEFTLSNFIVLDNETEWQFTLTSIDAPGFVLAPIGSSTIIGLAGSGTVTNGVDSGTFRIVFSTQFNETPGSLLARVDDETPALNTYSATVIVESEDTPEVPEPATLALMGLALSGMGLMLRRRSN